VLAVGDPIDVRSVHPQSLGNASVVKTDVLFVNPGLLSAFLAMLENHFPAAQKTLGFGTQAQQSPNPIGSDAVES
jgi:hypothetical protein